MERYLGTLSGWELPSFPLLRTAPPLPWGRLLECFHERLHALVRVLGACASACVGVCVGVRVLVRVSGACDAFFPSASCSLLLAGVCPAPCSIPGSCTPKVSAHATHHVGRAPHSASFEHSYEPPFSEKATMFLRVASLKEPKSRRNKEFLNDRT